MLVEHYINYLVYILGGKMKVSRFAEIVADKSGVELKYVRKVLQHTNKCSLCTLYSDIKLIDEKDILEVYCPKL